MEKIAIYDFCETIVNFQTANAFVEFIIEHEKTEQTERVTRNRKLYSKIGVQILLNVIGHFTNFYLDKYYLLSALKGMKQDMIDRYGKLFYKEVIKTALIEDTLLHIKKDKENGYEIILISASYEPVVKPFCREYGISCIITNELQYDRNQIFTGRIIEKDCMGKNKVRRLISRIPDSTQMESLSYSDSKSDIPILQFATRGVVVSKGRHKKWCDKYKFDEIVWGKL